MPEFQWDNQEVKGGYDHDADRVRQKRIKAAEYAPVDDGAGLRVLGKCCVCERPAVHKWLKDGTLICAKHWTHALAKRADDIASHPEKYIETGTRSAARAGSTRRRKGK